MSISLGLDVGAVSVKLAALGTTEDYSLLARLAETTSAFFFPQLPKTSRLAECSIVLSTYRRLQGNPLQAASELLGELCEVVPEEAIAGIRFTGSGGRTVARTRVHPDPQSAAACSPRNPLFVQLDCFLIARHPQ